MRLRELRPADPRRWSSSAPRDDHFERLVPAFEHDRHWLVPAGGATRAQTVINGLQALRERGATDHDWVLVHDAARCLLRPAWVERLIDRLRR
jgi:2-C-methyl-D-erythritol 4-phosphate cytidylyltransferase